MINFASIGVLDSEDERRNRIVRMFTARGHHSEPFDSVAEYRQFKGRCDLLLVHDRPARLERLAELHERGVGFTPLVVYAEEPAPDRIVDAVLGGALDYLHWPFDAERFFGRLQAAGERIEKLAAIRRRLVNARARIARLSPRERQVLEQLASGQSNKNIARFLEISPRTVEIHRANMMSKLGAGHTADAVRTAIDASTA